MQGDKLKIQVVYREPETCGGRVVPNKIFPLRRERPLYDRCGELELALFRERRRYAHARRVVVHRQTVYKDGVPLNGLRNRGGGAVGRRPRSGDSVDERKVRQRGQAAIDPIFHSR